MDNYLTTRFQALGDRTHFAVVELLLNGSASVSELAKPHNTAMPALTKHLGVLESTGPITSTKTERVRTCAINTEAFTSIEQWCPGRWAHEAFTSIEQWCLERWTHWDLRLKQLAQHLTAPHVD